MINIFSTSLRIIPVKTFLQGLTARRFRLQATGMTTFGRAVQSGFTLLEMVLVLFLIGLMASATLMLTENVEDQAKYDETKRRMEMMRKAIVGDPTRTINGGPEISGFVADMGRLPLCIAELIEPGVENLPVENPKKYASPCDASEIVEWHIDASTGLGFGWYGPYIQVLPERNGNLRFRDGYGNTDASDPQNSGWSYLADTSNARVQSFGFDGSALYPSGTLATIDPIVKQNNHLIDSNILIGRVRFLNLSNAIPSTPLKLKLNYPDGTSTPSFVFSNQFIIDASTAVSGFSPQMTFPVVSPHVSLGVRTIEVVCDDVNEYIYDGTCTNNTYTSFVNITISPTSQATEFNLLWDIP